jgi:hypothetical protein
MKPADLARALKGVPEKRLRLVELAREVVDGEGRVDLGRCLPLAAEITAAVEEARAYAEETERVRWALQRLIQGP